MLSCMRRSTTALLALSVSLPFSAFSSAQTPQIFTIAAAALTSAKAHATPALQAKVREDADRAMKTAPHSVMEKSMTPPSGDKHDYTSLSRYFWPNPATPNHLPYVRRDGESNPEIRDISDHDFLSKMGSSTRALALGWYFTGDERYAQHAALLLRTWFLVPATAMHPNMTYAQFVPGQFDGRGSGILDAREFAHALDAVALLQSSKNWTAADTDGMKKWFSDYYIWLETSANGKHEKATPNNHGSWFAVQEATTASFLGKTADVKRIAEVVRDQRIPSQFATDGLQKYELVRTNSFSYSAFNIEALTELAVVVAPAGVDIYAKQPGIVDGLDALLPYDQDHKWPHQQIGANMQDSICPALRRVATRTHAAKYVAAEQRFGCEPDVEQLINEAARSK